MGLFNKKTKMIIAEISKKNQSYHQDIEKEINELLNDLRHDFQENKINLEDFSVFIQQIQNNLSKDEAEQLKSYYTQVSKMKNCAKKSIEGLNYLSREHRKMTKEALHYYEEILT